MHLKILRHIIFWVTTLCLMALATTHAQEMPVPMDVQYSLFLKILSFDRNFRTRVDEKVVIGVLSQEGVKSSLQAKEDFLNAAAQCSQKQLFDKPIECVGISIEEGADLQNALAGLRLTAAYITPMRAVNISALARSLAERGIITLTGIPEYVEKGVVIGIGLRADRPLILINLTQGKRAGADLSAQLLRLAKVVD
ncbi:MAG: YfiR family protein [Ignavibacteriales bacterium]|nr:YfiR family protein [Ignavibacteriales bacterium]